MLAVARGSLSAAAFAQTGPTEYITNPEAHGWSLINSVVQNTQAFNAAIADASAHAASSVTGRGVVELLQGKTYTVRTTNGSINNQNACLSALSNVEIRTAGKPTRLSGNQGVIQFESWAGKSGVNNQVIFRFNSGLDNFKLGWLTLHGNKNTLSNMAAVNYIPGQDGGIHCMVLYGGTNVVLQEVLATHAICDAMYIRTTINPNLLIQDCTFTRCRRQGISLVTLGAEDDGADQARCLRLTISDIGDHPGDIGGQQPGAGIDVEPPSGGSSVNGFTLEDCDFVDVHGSRFHQGNAVTDPPEDGLGLFFDCRFAINDFKIYGLRVTNCRTGLKARDNPTFSNVAIVDLEVVGGANENLNLESSGSDGGTLVNWTIVNPRLGSAGNGAVVVESTLAASGHSVHVWKGNHNATLSNPAGRPGFTLHEGFPL